MRGRCAQDFSPPDPRILAESCGVQNNCLGATGNLQCRVSEALCLVGSPTAALAYTEPEAVCMLSKRNMATAVALCRGAALGALGRTDAAKAILECAVTSAASEDNLLGEALALRTLVEACGADDGEPKMRLGAVLRRFKGSVVQLAAVMRTRDGADAVD